MGGLISNNILIVVSVFHCVILPISTLVDHDQPQIEEESRTSVSDPFKIVNYSLYFNKYAFLTTHKAHASSDLQNAGKYGWLPVGNKSRSSVTQQLNSGVRALMLNINNETEEYYNGFKVTSVLDLLQELKEFLKSNPSEVVTLFLKDKVETPNGLTKIFNATGLTKYMLPLWEMPLHEGDNWPRVKDMVASNHRLVVFSSAKTKEETEGIGYQGNFVVEYQYGDGIQGTGPWTCARRKDSSPSEKKTSSLMLLSYLPSPDFRRSREKISKDHTKAIRLCHAIDSDHKWANFFDADYREGDDQDVGAAFQAVDFLNGKLLCGCDDVNSCRGSSWCPSEAEFFNKVVALLAEFGTKTKVIALLLMCAILGYTLHIVRYVKKKKV